MKTMSEYGASTAYLDMVEIYNNKPCLVAPLRVSNIFFVEDGKKIKCYAALQA